MSSSTYGNRLPNPLPCRVDTSRRVATPLKKPYDVLTDASIALPSFKDQSLGTPVSKRAHRPLIDGTLSPLSNRVDTSRRVATPLKECVKPYIRTSLDRSNKYSPSRAVKIISTWLDWLLYDLDVGSTDFLNWVVHDFHMGSTYYKLDLLSAIPQEPRVLSGSTSPRTGHGHSTRPSPWPNLELDLFQVSNRTGTQNITVQDYSNTRELESRQLLGFESSMASNVWDSIPVLLRDVGTPAFKLIHGTGLDPAPDPSITVKLESVIRLALLSCSARPHGVGSEFHTIQTLEPLEGKDGHYKTVIRKRTSKCGTCSKIQVTPTSWVQPIKAILRPTRSELDEGLDSDLA
ncbi:hypothetical protein BS47DRAFT_1402740 [Hydnum rufescens UP504]|uniref:Uncharacterized protein n=1 Tax=Hydnum rufescens UP504 TaxID=1448309 RepID=A0A9P6ABR5_9AGAM|nr:hypothetical protein BS47DRAFT_1402740 [Hydnum rufescens UP504]